MQARAPIGFAVARTFSPIDLTPDFVPVLGYLHDRIITPLGLALALRPIPSVVLARAREQAPLAAERNRATGPAGAVIIVLIWVIFLIWSIKFILSLGH